MVGERLLMYPASPHVSLREWLALGLILSLFLIVVAGLTISILIAIRVLKSHQE